MMRLSEGELNRRTGGRQWGSWARGERRRTM